ncbi:MAG TPA: hypothetical protein VH352_21320, partial [Pseudonocardiaceae bacterium]|nr:hypothetical protein [Pseudonocardiaceae bacterium]
MTGIDRGGDTPMEPPWTVDLLADLHAGVLDTAVAQRLWPQVHQDPDAVHVLNALDATKAELAALGTRPAPAMPAGYAARLDAVMAAEAARTFGAQASQAPPPPRVAPVVDLARARKRRNQRTGWIAGALVAAAAVGTVVISLPHGGTTPGEAGSQPSGGTPPLALTSGHLNSATLTAVIGRSDYGPLTDPAR